MAAEHAQGLALPCDLMGISKAVRGGQDMAMLNYCLFNRMAGLKIVKDRPGSVRSFWCVCRKAVGGRVQVTSLHDDDALSDTLKRQCYAITRTVD